jgi:hypothetical protein
MHPRVRGFLLFLLYAVVSNALGAAFGWLFILKLHAVDISDRSWRPSIFIVGETRRPSRLVPLLHGLAHRRDLVAVGFHGLFDFAAIYLFGAPNSGNQGQPIATKMLTGTDHGPQWLTGGPLGVEASWLVFPLIALLFLAFSVAYRPLRYNPPQSPPKI